MFCFGLVWRLWRQRAITEIHHSDIQQTTISLLHISDSHNSCNIYNKA